MNDIAAVRAQLRALAAKRLKRPADLAEFEADIGAGAMDHEIHLLELATGSIARAYYGLPKAALARIVARWASATLGMPTPEPQAEPVPCVAANGTPKKWTPGRLEELRAYRAEHGTTKAAKHFGVTPARVRALLPTGKPAVKGYSAFSQGTK